MSDFNKDIIYKSEFTQTYHGVPIFIEIKSTDNSDIRIKNTSELWNGEWTHGFDPSKEEVKTGTYVLGADRKGALHTLAIASQDYPYGKIDIEVKDKGGTNWLPLCSYLFDSPNHSAFNRSEIRSKNYSKFFISFVQGRTYGGNIGNVFITAQQRTIVLN